MVFLSDTQGYSELYFLRHGLAGQHGDPKYKDDSLRPLTAQGRKKMQRAAQGMKTLGLTFDLIFSSPYLRARQTAEIVAQAFKIKKIQFTDNLLPPASIKELLKEIHTRGQRPINNAGHSFLFVGHEPHLTEMISCLLKSDRPLAIDFKKGGLCSLTLDHPPKQRIATLNWLLTPTQLGLLGKKKGELAKEKG